MFFAIINTFNITLINQSTKSNRTRIQRSDVVRAHPEIHGVEHHFYYAHDYELRGTHFAYDGAIGDQDLKMGNYGIVAFNLDFFLH